MTTSPAQLLRAILIASAFFLFWLGGGILAWTLCPVLYVTVRDRARREALCRRILKHAYRLFHGYMRALWLLKHTIADEHEGHAVPRPEGPVVMIANHPSLVDVTAILATYDDIVCVAKSSLMRNFWVGRVLRFCGHIDGGGGEDEPMAGAALMQEAQKKLEQGLTVLVFPEGTRSPKYGMRRFRRGAFELAVRAKVPIWPIFVSCDPPALSKGMPIWKHPLALVRLRLHPLPLIPVTPGEGSRKLCREVETSFRERVGAPPFAGEAETTARVKGSLEAEYESPQSA